MTDTIPDKTHAVRAPSSTKRRELCPGSTVLEAGMDRGATRYSAEGTVAHQVMELCILEKRNAEAYVGRVFEADGFRFTVGMEMADAVNECLAYVELFVSSDYDDILMAETAVPIGHISGEPGAEGTSDVVGISDSGKRLVVLDLKYGKGVTVFVRDEHGGLNKQLGYYALGALELLRDLYPGIEEVTLGIMQPRTFNFDTVTVTVAELLELREEIEAVERKCDAAELIADPEQLLIAGLLNPSFDACQFCKAKKAGTCPARRDMAAGGPSSTAGDDDFEDLSV